MSRYETKTETGLNLAWGYDNPLKEYFFSAWYDGENGEDDDYVFSVSNNFTMVPHPENVKGKYTNSDILSFMDEYSDYIPNEHMGAIAFDLPF